jgi:hypothetical protein
MTKPSSPAQTHVQSTVHSGVNPPATAREARERADLAHWLSISVRATDPTTAQLILDFLGEHPQMREQHVGVYLVAKQTVQRDRIRHAKAMRRGQAVAATVRMLFKACTGVVRVIQSLSASTLSATTGIAARKAAPAVTQAPMPTQGRSTPSAAPAAPSSLSSIAAKTSSSTATFRSAPSASPATAMSAASSTVPSTSHATSPSPIRASGQRRSLHWSQIQPRRLSAHRIATAPQAETVANAMTFPTIVDPFAN